MLLAALSTEEVQAVQAVLLAGIAAWVAVRTRQIDTVAREADRRAAEAKIEANALKGRVNDLEANSGILKPRRADEDDEADRGQGARP